MLRFDEKPVALRKSSSCSMLSIFIVTTIEVVFVSERLEKHRGVYLVKQMTPRQETESIGGNATREE